MNEIGPTVCVIRVTGDRAVSPHTGQVTSTERRCRLLDRIASQRAAVPGCEAIWLPTERLPITIVIRADEPQHLPGARDINVPIGWGDAAVWPGDLVVGDGEGSSSSRRISSTKSRTRTSR